MTLTQTKFGRLPDGSPVELFALSGGGVEVHAITYGGIITTISVPDRDGRPGNVVLGHDTLEAYLSNEPYFGALIGRYANRIADGRLPLGGRRYQLTINNGPHHLHGGSRGFDQHVWVAAGERTATTVGVTLSRTSCDGEEGYPGTVRTRVTYRLNEAGELSLHYEAVTDAATVVNLTQHSYFDLSAGQRADVHNHQLTIDADHYTPVDATLIPTGDVAAVAGTAFDFREPVPIGARRAGDYDHNWVLRGDRGGDVPRHAALVYEPNTGRTLEVLTTEPGIQFYSGSQLDGRICGAGGRRFTRHAGLCLETQHFPNSPNEPRFPSTVLLPTRTYRSTTVWRFGCR